MRPEHRGDGLGGALLREKIVAEASRRVVIVVDDSKLSPRLGTRFALPVEVLPFGWTVAARYLESLGARPQLRASEGQPFVTDQGNWILDAAFGPMKMKPDCSTRSAKWNVATPRDIDTDVRPGSGVSMSRD